ncbi:hypothetical protein DDI_2140 [Dickeya dianthicola RNS04.9]|nr:hypothetical protein DDI_2140 [Dickeya dianthicola RNS04.9]
MVFVLNSQMRRQSEKSWLTQPATDEDFSVWCVVKQVCG